MTFLGMVGTYYGLWKAYQFYKTYQPQLQSLQNAGSSAGDLVDALSKL